MIEVVTYLRVNINDKWTNLGLIAEEDKIQEHFEFVEGLLKEKQRADELEHKLKKEIDESERQLRRWYEELKHADRLEKRWSVLEDKVRNRHEYATHMLISWMDNKEESKQWSAAKHELLMVMKDMHDLEEDGE